MGNFTFNNELVDNSQSAHSSFKRFVILVVMMLMTASSVFANDVLEDIDGLIYRLNLKTKTATLCINHDCSGDIVVPEKVEYYGATFSVVTFEDGCFGGCTGLTSITIPSSVTSLGDDCFWGCKGLTSIYAFMEKPCKIQETTFDNETIINATLYVPKGSLLDYWDDNQWKKFMNIEEFDATSIGSLNTNANDVQEVSRYSDNGQRLNTPAKGLNIVKYNNGTVKKIMVK